MANRDKKWIGISVLVVAALFFLLNKKQESQKEEIHSPLSISEVQKNEEIENGSSQLGQIKKNIEQEQSKSLTDQQFSEVNKCFPNLISNSKITLHQAIDLILQSEKLSKSLDQYADNQVFHLKLKNGEDRRLRIYFENGTKRLAFYSLDQDGDPLPLDVPVAHQFVPSAEVIQSYLDQGQLVNSEKDYLIEDDNKKSISLREQRAEFVELQYKQMGKFLGCNITSCRCIL